MERYTAQGVQLRATAMSGSRNFQAQQRIDYKTTRQRGGGQAIVAAAGHKKGFARQEMEHDDVPLLLNR